MGKIRNVLKAIQAYFVYFNPPSADMKKLMAEEWKKNPLRETDSYFDAVGRKQENRIRAWKRYKAAEKHRKQHNREERRKLRHKIVEAILE